MKRAAGCISRAFGNNKGSSVKDAEVLSIIGYRVNGNGNVRDVDFVPHYAVEV
jgi:hypothetical protein